MIETPSWPQNLWLDTYHNQPLCLRERNWLPIFKISKNSFISCNCNHLKIESGVVSGSLRPYGLQSAGLLHPWDFPGKNTRVGCHFLLQGIFPTQGSNQLYIAGRFFTLRATRESHHNRGIMTCKWYNVFNHLGYPVECWSIVGSQF